MFVIKLKDEYENYYNDIKNQLENEFDFETLIKEHPVSIKVGDKNQLSKNIGLSHIKNFKVKLLKMELDNEKLEEQYDVVNV